MSVAHLAFVNCVHACDIATNTNYATLLLAGGSHLTYTTSLLAQLSWGLYGVTKAPTNIVTAHRSCMS
jgi:hypothetical protein